MDKNNCDKPQFLGDCCLLEFGFAFDSSKFNSDGIGVPLVRIRDIKRGSTATYTTEPFDDRYIVKDGDLLIGMDGEFNLIKWSGGNAVLNQRVCRIRSNDPGLLDDFLGLFLSKELKKIEAVTSKVTVKHLSAKKLKQIEIATPAPSEQKRIVSEIEAVDAMVRCSKAAILRLDDLVKSRFNEMFGDALNSDNRWPERALGSMLDIARGGSPRPIKSYLTNDPAGINWIKIGDAVNGSRYIANTAERIKPSGVKKSRLVHSGDFLLSNSMSFGRPYILKTDGCIHDGWLVLQGIDKYFDRLFLYQLLASDDMLHRFRGLVRGGVVNNLNKDLVSTVSVMVPPISLQRDFAIFVQHVDKLRFDVQQQIDKLELLKSSLMQEYFG